MKSLMMIHLESLNYQLFMSFPELFVEIHKAKQAGMFFNHYFSTATSTLMVVGDIVYGGKEQYEVCTSLDDIPKAYFYEESLFDELKRKGYKTGLFVYPDGGDRESAEERHIAGFQNEMVLKPDYDEFLSSIDALVTDEPFAVMACNYISNISINRYADKSDIQDGTGRWRMGYECLDRCVGDIMNILREKNRLEDTCVILYGDHGDDLWGHGMHGGLTHAIEPLAALIHTPLIILDRDTGRGLDEHLVCATDLRGMIYDRMENGKVVKNIHNKYITARSSYAAQPVRKETFNKAYSITDGKFLMLVSNYGLELYDIEMDFQCCFNFLDLFCMEGELIRYDAKRNEAFRFHYLDFMIDREITRLRQTAYYLRKQLYDDTLCLYETAGRTERDMTQEMDFFKIHYRYR